MDKTLAKQIRKFQAGDPEAGNAVAHALLRAQALLSAVGALSAPLQEALTVKSIGIKLQTDVLTHILENLDLAALAGEIDIYEIVGEIDVSEIASEIDTSAIAQEADCELIANHIDLGDLASNINVSQLNITAAEVADMLDVDDIVERVASHDSLRDLVREMVEEATEE